MFSPCLSRKPNENMCSSIYQSHCLLLRRNPCFGFTVLWQDYNQTFISPPQKNATGKAQKVPFCRNLSPLNCLKRIKPESLNVNVIISPIVNIQLLSTEKNVELFNSAITTIFDTFSWKKNSLGKNSFYNTYLSLALGFDKIFKCGYFFWPNNLYKGVN